MLKRLWCTSSVLTNTVSSICCVAFASCHCWLKNSSDFIWLSTVKKGCILYKASIDWFISLHYPKIITSHRFVSYKFELGWPNYLKHFLKNTGWLHREENSSALIRQFTSVLPLACCTWWQEVGFAINPLLKPVILSNASSHSPDFKCNKFLQKLVFILFSSINFQAGTCRHTECQKVDKYPANRRKKQASLVELVVSSDCWSGDSPELPLGLKASPTKAGASHLNLLLTSLYSSSTSIALGAVLQIRGVSFGKHSRDGRCSVLARCYWVSFLTTISSVEPGEQRAWTQMPAGFSEF